MPKKSICVMGCGWMGLPLALALKKQGYHVVGSTTTPEKLEYLKAEGIEAYLTASEDVGSWNKALFEVDQLFLNIPPGIRGAKDKAQEEQRFLALMEGVLDRINPEKTHLVAASSTSVYPDWNMDMLPEHGGMGEPSGAAGKALRIFEQQCIDRIGADTTILRFAGLYGADRHPVKFFAGRKAIQGGMQRVNMVSLDRCLAVLDVVLHRPVWGQILNVCDSEHPTRKEFYTQAAKERGLDIPDFADDGDEPYGRVVILTDLD